MSRPASNNPKSESEIRNSGARRGRAVYAAFAAYLYYPYVRDLAGLQWLLPINACASRARRLPVEPALSGGIHRLAPGRRRLWFRAVPLALAEISSDGRLLAASVPWLFSRQHSSNGTRGKWLATTLFIPSLSAILLFSHLLANVFVDHACSRLLSGSRCDRRTCGLHCSLGAGQAEAPHDRALSCPRGGAGARMGLGVEGTPLQHAHSPTPWSSIGSLQAIDRRREDRLARRQSRPVAEHHARLVWRFSPASACRDCSKPVLPTASGSGVVTAILTLAIVNLFLATKYFQVLFAWPSAMPACSSRRPRCICSAPSRRPSSS